MAGILDFLSQILGGDSGGPVPAAAPQDAGNGASPTAQLMQMPSNWMQGGSLTGQAPQASPAAPAPAPAASASPSPAQGASQPQSLYQPNLISDPAGHFTVHNFLGTLGDALLQGSGHQPIYAPRIQAQQQANAVSQFLGNPDAFKSPGAFAALAKLAPAEAIDMYDKTAATRAALIPKFSLDPYGNQVREQLGQPVQIVSHGPGKMVELKPGEISAAQNPYGLGSGDAAAPPSAEAGASAPGTAQDAQGAGLPTGDQVAALITQQYPGAQVTSGLRTPEQNAAVDGVPNSAHLQDTRKTWARDIKLPPGTDSGAVAAQIHALGIPGIKALYEGPGADHSTGPHLHIQYIAPNGDGGVTAPAAAPAAPQGSQFSRVVAQGPAAFRPLTAEEKSQFPGATYMTPEGPHYAPVGSVPIDASDPGIRAAGAAMAEGKAMPAGRDQQSMRAIRDSAVTYLQNKYPGMTPEQAGAKLVQNEQDYNSGNTALKAWSSGKQSQTLDSINNVYGHLQAYKQLADALKSGDVRLINAAKNAAGTAFGQSGPMELQEVTQILGPEMEKVVAGAQGGTESERSGWAKSFAAANSPAQAAGVVNTATGLLARRLQSANLAYKNSTHRDDFTDRLLPDVANFYQSMTPAAPQGGALPKGWKYLGAVKK